MTYDPITGDPILHLGPKNDVTYDEGSDKWVSHRTACGECGGQLVAHRCVVCGTQHEGGSDGPH